MDQAKSGPDKRTIIDALVLACQHSALREIVGTDALRSVLDVEYRELIADGGFNLQPVWELFQDQPGFEPQHAAPPLCRFKSWERQLGVEIALPNQLRNLSEAEQANRANECDVPTVELQKILRGTNAEDETAAEKKSPRKRQLSQEIATHTDDTHAVSPRRRMLQIAASVVAVVCFTITGVVLYRDCAPTPSFQKVDLGTSNQIPIAKADRLGPQVRLVLSNESWLTEPESERREQLEAMLRGLESQGVQVIYIRDQQGKARAIAQLYDNGNKMRIVFK